MAPRLILERPLGGVLRDIRRGLLALCLAGSTMAGFQHASWWVWVPPVILGACLAVESRAVRRMIGRAAWASEGFARFTFGTGMGHLCRDSLLCTALFYAASLLSAILPG